MSTKLYIMKFEREGDCFLKVGKSNNCEKRLKDLSVNHTGVLLREYDDITIDWGKVEGRLHSDFKSQVYLSDILLTNSTESYPISLMNKDSCGIFSCEVKYKQLSYFLETSVVVLRKALRKFEGMGYISSIEDSSCNKTYIWIGINEDERVYNCQGVSSRTKKEWAAYFINRVEIEDLKEQMKAMKSLAKEARKHKPK